MGFANTLKGYGGKAIEYTGKILRKPEVINAGTGIGKATGGIGSVLSGSESVIGFGNAMYNKDGMKMLEHGGGIIAKAAGCVIGGIEAGAATFGTMTAAGCAEGINTISAIGDAGNFIVGKAIDTHFENETKQWEKIAEEQGKQAYQAGLERRRKREAEQAFGQRMSQGYTERMNQNEPIDVPSDTSTGDSDSSSDTTSTILSGIMQGVTTAAQVALPIMQNQALAEQQQQQMQQLQMQQQQQLQRQQAYSNAQAIPPAPQITKGLPPGTPPNDGMHDADWYCSVRHFNAQCPQGYKN